MTDFDYSGETIGIVEQGEYKGRYYIIAVNGMPLHPCAYITTAPEDNKGFISRHVHCGISWDNMDLYQYYSKGKITNEKYAKVRYWGWDYGHVGDYSKDDLEGKKWSLEEVKQDIFCLVDLLTIAKNSSVAG